MTEVVNIRIKPARAPYQRAGFQFAQARQWHEFEVDYTPENGLRLQAVHDDPNLVLEFKHGDDWLSGPAWADALSGATMNTILPTAEPTLERDASEIDHQAKTPENPADQGKAAEELTPPPPPVVNDTSSSTVATVPTGDPATATVAVEEAAPTAKTETRPAPKAHKPKA